MTSQGPLRIGHHERETAQRALDQHLADGRLDADEYADRYARISVARYRNELDEQFLDLPLPHAAGERVSRRSRPPAASVALDAEPRERWPLSRRLVVVLPALAIIAGVVLTSMFHVGWVFWFVVPALFWGGGSARRPWRHGPYGRSDPGPR